MALPAGIATVTVNIGPLDDYQGSTLSSIVITFTPSQALVWTATGTVLFPRPLPVTIDGWGTASITLPATDQAGFSDGAGNAVTNFGYYVDWKIASRDIAAPARQLIALPKAVPTVNLDLIVSMSSVAPTVVSTYAPILDRAAARSGTGPVVWTGGTSATPPTNGQDGDLWIFTS